MRLACALVALAACSHGPASVPDAPAGAGGYVSATFSSDQGQLDYQVYVPSGYQPGVPVPLVLVISGCLQTIPQLEQVSRFSGFKVSPT